MGNALNSGGAWTGDNHRGLARHRGQRCDARSDLLQSARDNSLQEEGRVADFFLKLIATLRKQGKIS